MKPRLCRRLPGRPLPGGRPFSPVPRREPCGLHRQGGYSLLEMTVAMGISLALLAGLFATLYQAQVVFSDFEDRTASTQGARITLLRIQRDLATAGTGLAPMLPVFPEIVPREDLGIEVRHNSAGVTSFLTESMVDLRSVTVSSVEGVTEGQKIAVYDASGSIDIAEIAMVEGNVLTLDRNLGKLYGREDGAAVVLIQEICYWVEPIMGVQTLMRQVDSELALPVLAYVVSLSFTYYDDSIPSAEFDPETPEDQTHILSIGVELVVETGNDRLDYGGQPWTTLRTRITPRALTIS